MKKHSLQVKKNNPNLRIKLKIENPKILAHLPNSLKKVNFLLVCLILELIRTIA